MFLSVLSVLWDLICFLDLFKCDFVFRIRERAGGSLG